MNRELLERRLVFDDGERVAMLLRAGGFTCEAADVVGRSVREVVWCIGRTPRGRKTVAELLDAVLEAV